MGMKPGSSSSPAPAKGPGDRAADALVVLGIAASLVFIVGSALLNYRMGYASAGNPVDGTIYGGLAAAGDALKALSPFVAASAWRRRQWAAVAAAAVVFAVFTSYSFTSSLGFSSSHRADKAGHATALMEQHDDARKTIARVRARLDALGPQRSGAEVKQAIANALAAPVRSGRWTVEQVSDGCALNKPATRQACLEIANLKAESLRALEAERLEAELKALAAKTSATPVVTTADAQTDALAYLSRLFHVTAGPDASARAGEGLALLMAVFIELGSGLGLYIVTTPWRAAKDRREPAPSPPLAQLEAFPPLERFVAESLQRRRGAELTVALAFGAYREWCGVQRCGTLGKARFERAFLKLAREIGLDVEHTMSGWSVRDVTLGRAPALRLAAPIPARRNTSMG